MGNKQNKNSNRPLAVAGMTLVCSGLLVPLCVNGSNLEVKAAPYKVPLQGQFYRGYRAMTDFDDWESQTGWKAQVDGNGNVPALAYADWLYQEPRDITPGDWNAGSNNGGEFVGGVQLRQVLNGLTTSIENDEDGNPVLHLEGDAALYQLFHMTKENHKTAILVKEQNKDGEAKVFPVTLKKESSTALYDRGYNKTGRYQDPLPIWYTFGEDSSKATIPNSYDNNFELPNAGNYTSGLVNYFQDEYGASFRKGYLSDSYWDNETNKNQTYYIPGKTQFNKTVIPGQVSKVCGLGIVGAENRYDYRSLYSCNYLYDYTGYSVDIPLLDIVDDLTKPHVFDVKVAISMYSGGGSSQVVSDYINYVGNPLNKEVELSLGGEEMEEGASNTPSNITDITPTSKPSNSSVEETNEPETISAKFSFGHKEQKGQYVANSEYLITRYLTNTAYLPLDFYPRAEGPYKIDPGITVATGGNNVWGDYENLDFPKDISSDPNAVKWVSGNRGRNMLYLGKPGGEVKGRGDYPQITSITSDKYNSYKYIPANGLQKLPTGVIRYTPNPDSQVVINLSHTIVPGTPGNYDYSNTTVAEEEQFTYNTQTDKSAFLNKKGPYDGAEYIQYARINGGEVVTTSVDGKYIDFSKYVDTNKGGTINVELFYAKPDIHPDDPLGCVGSECGEIKVEGYHNMYLKKYTGDAKDGEKPKLVNHYAPLVDIEGDHIFMVDNLKSTITAVSDNNNKYSQVTTDTAYVNNEALDKFVNDEKNKVARYKAIQSNIVNSSHINPREKVKHEGIKDNLRKKYSEIKDTKDLNNNKYEEEILSKNKLDGLYKAWLDTENVDMTKWNDDNTVSGVWDSNFDKDNLDVKYRTDLNYHTALRPNYVPRGAVRYFWDVEYRTFIKNGEEVEEKEWVKKYYWDYNAYQEYDNTEITGVKNFSKEYEVKGKNPFNVGKTFGNLDRNVEPGYSKTLVGFESMLDGNKYNSKSTLRKVYEQFGYTDGSVDGVIPTQQAIPIGGKMLYMNPFDVSDMPYKEKANEAHSGIPNMMNSSQVDNVITGNNGVFHSVLYYDKTKAKVYFDHVDSEDAKVFEEYKEGNPAAIRGDVNQLALNPLRVANGVELSARSLPSPYGLNYTYSLPVKYSHDLHELKLDGVMAVGQDTGVPAFGAKQDVTAKYKAYYPTRKGNTTKAKAPDELVTVNNGSVLFTPLDTNIGDTIRTRMVVGGVGLSDLTFIDDTYNRVESYLYGRGENTAYSSARSDIDREGEGVHTGASNLITADDLKVKPDIYRVNGVRVGNGPDFNKEVLGGN